ncbi:MAG: PilZ domain-containing protein [bacterium]
MKDSTPKPVSVEVLCLSMSPPLIQKGKLMSLGEDTGEVILDEAAPALQPGIRVVLEDGRAGVRLMGTVKEAQGTRLLVETGRAVRPDKRGFPRLPGGICLRYLALSAGEERLSERWMNREDPEKLGGDWREPDPFMDFSGSGLRFEDELVCKVGDLLLLELRVPPSEQRWRAKARVVRVEPTVPGNADAEDREEMEKGEKGRRKRVATHQIAVEFEDLPREAREALTAFTLRIQNALLGIR